MTDSQEHEHSQSFDAFRKRRATDQATRFGAEVLDIQESLQGTEVFYSLAITPAAKLTFDIQWLESAFGTVDEICEELEKRRSALGISYITVGDSVMEAFAPVVAKLAGN